MVLLDKEIGARPAATPKPLCQSVMTELRTFVDEIASKVAALTPADFVSNGQMLPLEVSVLIKLDLTALSQRFSAIVGRELVDEFYRDYEPKHPDGSFHLALPLARLIPSCCRVSPDTQISLDSEQLLVHLSCIADSIHSGKVDYSICFRITNIDIEDDFDLAEGIRFRKLSREVVQSKYPIDRQFTVVSPMCEQHWLNHRVEVVIPACGTPADLQQRLGIEQCEALINSIIHTFLLANIPPKTCPFVTHVLVDSPFEAHCIHRGIGGLSFSPSLLTPHDITSLQKTYAFLADAANDAVLQTAVDRFILGRKQDDHHPNRINEPHWDKTVDYVIAMETLFLTVEGNPVAQELAYRFRLNGASLLRECTGGNVRQNFYALKHLYELRCKVVHGSDDSSIIKVASKFIAELQIDCPNHKHSLGRLMLITKQVETWLTELFFHLASLPIAERPFRKKDAWEAMLWQA